MLELKSYTKAEIVAILGTSDRQGIKKKLNGYGVEYSIEGQGDFIITITAINNPFKVFCITTLGIPAQADFHKLKILYYHLFCCPDFATYPYEVMASVLRGSEEKDTPSNKTIGKWVAHLGKINFVAFDKEDCVYYAIRKRIDGIRICKEITKEVYGVGWSIYWTNKDREGTDVAYFRMFNYVGGHPCRKAKIKPNAIYLNEINQFIDILTDEYMR